MIRTLRQGQGVRILSMSLMLSGAVLLTWYCHARLGVGTVFTHLFYIPILLAALWWRWAGLAVPLVLAVVLGVSHEALRGEPSAANNYLRGLMFLGVGLVAVLLREELGRKESALRAQKERLGRLATQLAVVEEDLRRDVSADLHDHVGQTLVAAKIQAGLLCQTGDPQAKDRLAQELIEQIDQVLKDVRSLTFQLCPPALYEIGLEAGLSWLLEQFEQRHGLQCRLQEDGRARPLSRPLLSFLFQGVREALLNVVKHAEAKRVDVTIASEQGQVLITVEDDGKGLPPGDPTPSDSGEGGFGLFSLRERLQSLGGSLEIHSAPNRGCKLVLSCPREARPSAGKAPWGPNLPGKTPAL